MARLFFAVRQNFFEKPADHAPIALRNNAYRNQNNSCIRCDAARDTVIAISTDSLVSPGKCAGPRCHALLIRASGTDVSDQEHQAVKVASLVGRIQRAFGVRSIASPSQRLLLAFDWPSELRWDYSVYATRLITLMKRYSLLAARCVLFGEVTRAGTYFYLVAGFV